METYKEGKFIHDELTKNKVGKKKFGKFRFSPALVGQCSVMFWMDIYDANI